MNVPDRWLAPAETRTSGCPATWPTRWRRRNEAPPRRVWVTIADHFEPLWKRPTDEVAAERVATWRREWPRIAARHQDADRPAAPVLLLLPRGGVPARAARAARRDGARWDRRRRGAPSPRQRHRAGVQREGDAVRRRAPRAATGCCAATTAASPSASSTATGRSTTPARRPLVRRQRRDLAPSATSAATRTSRCPRRPTRRRPGRSTRSSVSRTTRVGRAPTRGASLVEAGHALPSAT